ncbi:hypothetical protein [Arenimonas sp.]|jgi:hypothetical protein|uniref:hypothetical protein n=1 Tax=Arenimonas sp. TaxID=1872635 RepID=UPI0037C0F6D2
MSGLVALICIVILFSSILIVMSILHLAKVLGENNEIMIKDLESRTKKKSTERKTTKKENNPL